MSIASYRMATSPSDQNNQNVLAWLDRMETSVRTAGTSAGTKAFQLDSRTRPDVEDDSDDESDDANDDPTERGTVVDSQEREDANNDDEKLFSIPDATVPIGLIANLSLGNKKKTKAKVEDRETDDDDDLVSLTEGLMFQIGDPYYPIHILGGGEQDILRAGFVDSC